MNRSFGAFNSRGFSSSVSSGAFPKESHLTYEGVFNELKYNVGKPTAKPVDLHFGYARYQFPHSAHDQGINDFLAVFVKGESDGKDRDTRRLNAVLCLDISGSMDGPLERNNQGKQQSRLALSREAIKMFVSKLRADDAVGIVLFDTEAETFLPLTLKKDIPQSLYKDIDGIKARGGTTIRTGLQQSTLEMKKWLSQSLLQNCQNRIIMLTDVGDNSIQGEKAFIELASQESNINLTIVGVSNDFQSHVCESLKDIRGFNYFCAVNQGDIKKYIFQQFDFNFFPSVYNLQISISSEDIHSFEVYGVPDADKVKQYNGSFQQPRESYVVTKVKSSFPSDIQIHADSVFTYGGLILLKLKRNSKEGFFKAKIKVAYESPDGSKLVDQYAAGFEFHQQEQFFSQESLRQAVEGFIFVSEVKQLLAEGKTEEGKKHIYERYWKTLEQLQKFTPKSKLQDLKNIIKIVEKIKPASQTAEK